MFCIAVRAFSPAGCLQAVSSDKSGDSSSTPLPSLLGTVPRRSSCLFGALCRRLNPACQGSPATPLANPRMICSPHPPGGRRAAPGDHGPPSNGRAVMSCTMGTTSLRSTAGSDTLSLARLPSSTPCLRLPGLLPPVVQTRITSSLPHLIQGARYGHLESGRLIVRWPQQLFYSW